MINKKSPFVSLRAYFQTGTASGFPLPKKISEFFVLHIDTPPIEWYSEFAGRDKSPPDERRNTMNTYYITVDSFGSYCPENWEEIADFLNAIIDERGISEDHDAVNELWEAYCNGELEGAPAAL